MNIINGQNLIYNQGINEILYDIPQKKTIIFLKGLLRAGKRVDTKNIIMVHDTSVSNVDTTVQSLLGRCLNKIKILKYDLSPNLENLYGKTRKNKEERKKMILIFTLFNDIF